MESFVPNIFTRVSVMALVLLVRETEDDVDINILYHQYLVCGIAVETPEKVLQDIKKYIDIGVTHFILHFIGLDETTLRLFDTKVIRNTYYRYNIRCRIN